MRVAFARTDERRLGAVETEYRVGDGEWTPYVGAFDVVGNRGHQVDFRSIDLAGNVENYQSVTFTIRRPATRPTPNSCRRRRRRRRRAPFAALEEPPRRCGHSPRCAAAGSGQRELPGRRARHAHPDRRAAVARKLKLKSGTLARKVSGAATRAGPRCR